MDDDKFLDDIVAEFDSSWSEGDQQTEEITEEVETQTEEVTEEVQTGDEQGTEEVPPADDDSRNRAFRDLRQKAESNEQYAGFFKQLAEKSGYTPEQLMEMYQKREMEEQAKSQGVPLDVLQRLNSAESESKAIKEQLAAEKINTQIENIRSKYNATDDEIKTTFMEMAKSGVDPRVNPNVNFESFYRAAHFDRILESKVNEAKQQSLEDKKKRQESATVDAGGSTAPPDDGIDALVDKDVKEILENWS